MSELVTIADDALAPHAMGTTFDYEGQPKRRVVLDRPRRGGEPVTDSYWAAKTRPAEHRARAARAQLVRPDAAEPARWQPATRRSTS